MATCINAFPDLGGVSRRCAPRSAPYIYIYMWFHDTCAPRTCASNCCPLCSVLCLCAAMSVHNPVLVSVAFPVSVSALLRARSPCSRLRPCWVSGLMLRKYKQPKRKYKKMMQLY